jgi:competence protein ComEC
MATNFANPSPSPLRDLIWQAPLVPLALAATAGIVLDRFLSIPLSTSLTCVVACVVAWGFSQRTAAKELAVIWLWLAFVAGGTAYHQWWRESIAANDIRFAATLEGRPVRLRGVIDSEPIQSDGTSIGPLRPFTENPR